MALFEEKDCLSPIKDKSAIIVKEGTYQNALYTFCIPTYKRSKELKEALDSVFAQQTNIPFNVIISDNNPERNDETEDLINVYYADKENLRYIKNADNLGMAGNWNRLILECKTEYMVLFHDDDVLFPFFLEKIDCIQAHYPGVSVLNSGKIDWKGDDMPAVYHKGSLKKHLKQTNYCKYLFGPPSGCLFKVLDLKKIGGFDGASYPSIDYVAIEKLCLADKLVLATTEPLMLYRVGENATAKIETQLKWLDIDYQIKNELKDILGISNSTYKMALWFEIKMRLRALRNSNVSCSYMQYKPGSRLFCLLYALYFFMLRRRIPTAG